MVVKRNKILLFAILLLVASSSLSSQTAEEWKKLGNIELDSLNYNKAIEYYQKAIETDSNYFDAYYNIGIAFYSVQEYDKAVEYYTKAIAKNDKDASPYFALGGVYAENQDYDKAIEMFKEGITLKPISPVEHYYMGFLYQEKGNSIYSTMYLKKAAQMGDSIAQQYFNDNEISWEDNFYKPNYEQIKLNIENKKSNCYYPTLWDKFQQGDTTMTLNEKQHLYYGYVFNKNYSPYLSLSNAEQVNAILNKEEPTKEEWEKLVSLLNVSLGVEPFGCRSLYYQSVAFNALKKSDEADKNIRKIQCILTALTSTGDGLSKETAIHVIAVPNEYDYLFLNSLSMAKQSLINGGYDVLYLKPNEDGLEEMWFDVNQSLNFLNKDK